MFSVIIPAHNEASVIERCLSSMTKDLTSKTTEIIVVCNGCTDDTAQRARQIAKTKPYIRVIETSTASKIHALNLGDQHAQYFPRAYIDADIQITRNDLLRTISALNQDSSILIAAPKLDVDLCGSSFAVKAFYTIWMQLPYFTTGQMVGSGIFIMSEKGRSRFEAFPEVISDDGYARSLFNENERRMFKESSFKIFAPKTLKNLVKIKTRVRFGNMEVAQKYPIVSIGRDNRMSDMIKLVLKKPWIIGSACIYIYVQLQTKRLSKARMAAADFTTWERDDSSRVNDSSHTNAPSRADDSSRA